MTDLTPAGPDYPIEREALVADYLDAKAARDKAQDKLDELSERLIKQMEQDQRKSITWRDGKTIRTITYVQGHTTIIDEVGLRRKLTAKVFDRYTKRVLDRKKMEEAMDTGEVDHVVVASYVTQRPNKPFLKYSAKDAQ
jgi:hypothetical protein